MRTASHSGGMIRTISHLLPNHDLKRIYVSQVRSIMEYWCAVWSGDNISMLQKLQDFFCRENHVKLPPVQATFNYLTLLLFYKIKNKLSPMYLQRLLLPACSASSHYHLRGHNFPLPTVRSSRALKAFLPRSIILWNDLAPDIQALRAVALFKLLRII